MRIVWIIALAVAGCRHPATSSTTTSSSGTTPTAPPVSASSCMSIVTSYDALVSSGGTCRTDADCECFQGGVSPQSACGGVTDHATAAKLEKLRADYESGICNALSCAGWICKPACSSGHCAANP